MAASAKQVREALGAIERAHDGVLKPEDVVETAKDPEHVLHDRFDWNNETAGHAYRLEQARSLIRRVKIEYVVSERTIKSVVYVEDPEKAKRESGYAPVARGLTDVEFALAIVSQEFGRALAALERARALAAVLNLETPVEDIVIRLRELALAMPSLKVA